MLEINNSSFFNKIEFGDLEFEQISLTYDAVRHMTDSELSESDCYKSCKSIMIIRNPEISNSEKLQSYCLHIDMLLGIFPSASSLSLSWMAEGLVSDFINTFIATKIELGKMNEEIKSDFHNFKQIKSIKVVNSKYMEEFELIISKSNVRIVLVQNENLS